jgi:DNA-binding LacI/PurR family transcriptional regulator
MSDRPKRATIRDVAIQAGVSFQTVSLVLNHPEKVADKTLAHIRAVIDALHFVPSMAARSMRQIRTKTLACISFGARATYDNRSFQIQDTYWNNVLQMLGRASDAQGYALLQRHQNDQDANALAEVRQLFQAGRIDGVIAIVETVANPVLLALQQEHFPLVVFGTRDPALPYVAQTNAAASAEVVDHLYAQGCRRIAFISGERDGRANEDVNERLHGYRTAMQQHGLPVEPAWALAGDWSLASGHRIAQQLCGTDAGPDALIFASDRMALGALKGLHDIGRRVPSEVRVVGFDNMQYDDFSVPPLTSVHSPVYDMATTAVQILVDRIEERADDPLPQHMFATSLVLRASSGVVTTPGPAGAAPSP